MHGQVDQESPQGDAEVKAHGRHRGDGQQFVAERGAPDQLGLVGQRGHGVAQGLGQEGPGQQAGEQVDRVVTDRHLEDPVEDEQVEAEQPDRREDWARPCRPTIVWPAAGGAARSGSGPGPVAPGDTAMASRPEGGRRWSRHGAVPPGDRGGGWGGQGWVFFFPPPPPTKCPFRPAGPGHTETGVVLRRPRPQIPTPDRVPGRAWSQSRPAAVPTIPAPSATVTPAPDGPDDGPAAPCQDHPR